MFIFSDFEYVVTKKPPPPICFGSGLDRDVLSTHGPSLSPFMRRSAKEIQPDLGPGTYEETRDAFYDVKHKVPKLVTGLFTSVTIYLKL